MKESGSISWEQLHIHYEKIADLPPADRKTYMDTEIDNPQLKEELISLLDNEESSAQFFDTLSDHLIDPALDELKDLPPASGNVYNYKLLKKLGRGGMGTVYLAERSDDSYKNKVAVKILRRGMDTDDILSRFQSERQILAQLNHPNITHLLDGGVTTDGRPYFVMEYVEGTSITQFCDNNRLTVKDRIDLFSQVCEALAYAHQNLVIHRDLKPENILVTDQGIVKLLDFGIAKLISDEGISHFTKYNQGQRLMTPDFASPEQVKGGHINTSSDIYQLGLILYNLLSGANPQPVNASSLYETEQVILHHVPPKPSTSLHEQDASKLPGICNNRRASKQKLRSILSGDLDTIVMKAIHKEPERRFSSVIELKEDLERFKKGLPIKTQGDRIGYKTAKFIQRNRYSVALTSVFLLLMLLFAVFYNITITEQKNQAQNEAVKSAQITSFLIEMFEANDPTQSQGRDITAWDLLEQGEERIEMLEGQPEVQSQMYEVTGQIYRKMGYYEKSHELLEKSRSVLLRLFDETHPEVISVYDQLGLLYSDMGRFAEADSLLRKAMEMKQATAPQNELDIAESYYNLGFVLRRTGDYDAAEEMYRTSYDIRRRYLGRNDNNTLSSLSSLGVTLLNKADYEATEEIFREVLLHRRTNFPHAHPDLAMSLNNLGAVLLNIGQFEEAEQLFRESLAMRREIFGDSHPTVALTTNNLGISLSSQKKVAEASGYLARALEMRTEILGEDNVSTAISLFCIGELELHSGNPQASLEVYEKAHVIFEKHLSEDHSFTARTKIGIGNALHRLGEPERAKEYMEQGYHKALEIHDEDALEIALAKRDYALYLIDTGNYPKGYGLLNRSLEIFQLIEPQRSVRQDEIERLLADISSEIPPR